MPNGSEALDFEAVLKTTDFRRELATLRNDIKGFVNTTTTETKKIDNAFSNIAKVAAGAFAFTQLSDLPSKIIQVRGEFQNLEIAFTTMLKSKGAADKLLGEITQFAAKTPFTLTDVATGAKQLLAYGSSVKTVISEIRTLGDVSAGVSAPIGDLIYLYGTLRTQGRAYSVDIRQFASRGIPIYEELAKVLKINSSEVNNFVEAGKVGFKEVEQAFKNMTTNGGIFEGLTEKTSKSLTGLLSNFKDAVDRAFNDLGKSQEGLIATGITTATSLVDNYQEVLDILTVLVVTYGVYKAALVSISIAQKVASTVQLIDGYLNVGKALGPLTAQQLAFNNAVKTNPYVLAATALAALVTYLYVYADETKKIVSANELLVDVNKSVTSGVRSQQVEINSLVSVLKNQSVAESQRLEAYEKLKSINPDIVKGLDFQAAKTADLTKEVNNYILSLEKRLRLEATQGKLKEAIDQQITAEEDLAKAKDKVAAAERAKNRPTTITGLDARGGGVGAALDLAQAQNDLKKAETIVLNANRTVQTIIEKTEKIYTTGSGEQIRNKIKDLEMLQGAIKNKLSPAYKKYEDQIISLKKQLNEGSKPTAKSFSERLAESNDVGNLLLLKSQAKTENEIDALSKKIEEKKKDLDKTSTDYKKLQKAYDQLNPKTTTEKPEEVFPFGSLKYWEDVSRKAEEAISKLTPEQSAKVAQFQQQKLNADKQAEAIRKQFTIRSFDEEIEYKKQQYELYNRWVEFEGQGAANANFSELIRQGDSFKAYLEAQILHLQAKIDAGTATAKDNENIVILKSTLKVEDNTFEKYRESIFKAKLEVGSLTEFLAALKAEQEKLSDGDVDKVKFIAEQIIATEKQRSELFKQFALDNNLDEAKSVEIKKYYDDLRLENDKKYIDKKIKAYQEGANAIDNAEKAKLSELAIADLEKNSAVYKELTKVVRIENRKQLVLEIEKHKNALQLLKSTGQDETQLYKDKAKKLKDLEKDLYHDDLVTVNNIASVFGQIGSELGNINGAVGDFGKLLSNVASQADLITVSFDKTAIAEDKILAGLKGVVNLINVIVTASQNRKKAEAKFNANNLQYQNDYNIALNEQLGIQSEINSSGFVKNYAGIISDNSKKYLDAQKNLQKALELFDKGKAINGQKNAVDLGNVGKATGAGAAIGAAVGSVVPVIGTAIGAIVGGIAGAITGIFAGKSKQDTFTALLEKYPKLISKSENGVKTLNVELAKTLIANNQLDGSTSQLVQSAIDWQGEAKEALAAVDSVILELSGALGNELRDNLVQAFKDGTSAAEAFGESVSKVLENIITQTLFSAVFSSAFDDLKNQMNASFDILKGGDGVISDDLVRFYEKYPELAKVFTQGLADAKKEAEKRGLDIYKSSTGSSSSNSLTGAIKGVTEETAGLLAGQFNAIRITGANHLQVSRDSLLQLTTIANNSRYLQRLESIDNKLGKTNNDLRAGGL